MKTAETSPTEPSRGSSASLALRATGHWFSRRPSLVFLIIWLAFDISLNTRYPGSEPKLWYLVPSPDVIVIFFGFALCGRLNWELPRPARGVLVAWFFLVRFVRFGDGLQGRYYNQPFNLYTDLPLVPELIRFAHSTLKWWQFTPVAVTVLALLLGFWFAFYRALRFAEHYLREPKNVQFFAALAGAAFLFTWLNGHPPRDDELYRGGFAVSAIPRLRHEIDFLRSAYSKEAGQ
ncbi:MAG TPA: hypothetical protein VHW01_16790, partial [Polyangiaceae bacterium]|nr:hypothetical protein [Polyangiaceae bacterium]